MIIHTVERARRARLVSRVIVATDDRRVADRVQSEGIEARLTSPFAPSGTDRVAEVAAGLASEIIVNLQGDEPLIEPSTIDAAIEPLLIDPDLQMSTTSEPVGAVEEVFDPGVVKVVVDARGFALYFSRAPVPYIRPAPGLTLEETLRRNPELLSNYRKHTGLYVYRNEFLKRFTSIKPSLLERLESLEQLRALENGYEISVVRVEHQSIGVDTEQDYERVKRFIEEKLL